MVLGILPRACPSFAITTEVAELGSLHVGRIHELGETALLTLSNFAKMVAPGKL